MKKKLLYVLVALAMLAGFLPGAVPVLATPAAGNITTVAGNGTAAFGGDGGPATIAKLSYPFDVAVDTSGNLYIADQYNHRVRKVDAASGNITTVAGNGTQGFSGDGGPATSASLNNPVGVTVDNAGNLYIADLSNHRIRKVNTSGIITTVAGNGIQGSSGDSGPATGASLKFPYRVAFDAAGNFYIPDSQNHRIRKVDTSGIITTVAGTGTAGFSGDGTPATNAKINYPYGVAVDGAGNLYIADSVNNRIRKRDIYGIMSTVSGNGTAGFSGDGGPATAAQLNSPYGVACDGTGNFYIADPNNHRIRKVNASGIISTVAGNGTAGYGGDGGPATGASLNLPVNVAIDGVGNLFIADYMNHRIRKVEGLTAVAAPKIVFVSDRDSNLEIYSMNADSSNQTRLTSNTAYDNMPMPSPDGSKIAFVSGRDGNREIYVMSANGTGQTRLTNNTVQDLFPTWSPDGNKIAFATDRDGNREIYVMNADGTNPVRLTNNPAIDGMPAWSPDGAKIAFISLRDGDYAEIYVMNANGTNQTRLTNNHSWDIFPAWSPDGNKIAFSSDRDGNFDIYVMDASGTNQTRLTTHTAVDWQPQYSPDGTGIAFCSVRDGNWEIYTMNTNGDNQTRLTNNTVGDWLRGKWQGSTITTDNATGITAGSAVLNASLTGLGSIGAVLVSFDWGTTSGNYTNSTTPVSMNATGAFSANITGLAPGTTYYFRAKAVGDGTGYGVEKNFTTLAAPVPSGKLTFIRNGEVYVMNADGSRQTRLTNNGWQELSPAWSPDGKKIAFVRLVGSSYKIYVMNADASNQTQLTDYAWGDLAPAWSPDGTKIAFEHMPVGNGNSAIYVMNADGSNQSQLTADGQDPTWSPDGTKIAFGYIGVGGIWVMNAIGANQTRLTADGQDPAWSPDGTRIVFGRNPNGNFKIFVMNTDGSNQTQLTNNVAVDRTPAWSPDSTMIVLESQRDGNPEIYVMNADGSNQRRITNDPSEDTEPSWAQGSLPVVPTVTTDNATNITTNSARLSGTLTTLGSATSANVSFDWGMTPGSYTNSTTLISVNATGAFSANITGLSANTTYFFRAKAVGDGVGYGVDKTFTTLVVGGTISGHVYQSDNTTPIAGAKIAVYDYAFLSGSGAWVSYGFATTAADGSYQVLGLPTGQYGVRVTASGYAGTFYNNTYYTNNATAVSVTAPNDTPNINFSLGPGGSISGLVTQSDNITPIANLSVQAFDAITGRYIPSTVITNSLGSYTISGLPVGSYKVKTYAANTGLNYIDEWYNNKSSQSNADAVVVTALNNTPNINFSLEAGGSISGKVTDQQTGGVLQDATSGNITLSTGWHKFVYRQQEYEGGQASRAAFKAPDDTAWRWFSTSELDIKTSPNSTAQSGILLINKKNTWNKYPQNHSEMVACVDSDSTNATGWYGSSIVSIVNQNENIQGNDDYYTSYYEAYFYVNTPGIWHFSTDSDDASEIVIDTQVVAYWYNGHGSANRWENKVDISLSQSGTNMWIASTRGNADGSYTFTNVPSGSYIVSAMAPGYLNEWYNNKSSQSNADAVVVTAPNNIPNINFNLEAIVPKPDLTILEKHEVWTVPGVSYRVFFVVQNIGTATAVSSGNSTFEIGLNVNGVPIEQVSVPNSLAPGANWPGSFSANITLSQGGFDKVAIQADVNNEISEPNEGNNWRWNIISWPPKPNLTVYKWEEWQVQGGTYIVRYKVENNGNAPAPAGHDTQLKIDGTIIATQAVPVVLNPGEAYQDVFGYTANLTGGVDSIAVTTDVNNEVVESVEGDNTMLNTLAWPAKPDLVIKWKNERWVQGQELRQYNVHYSVQNIGNAVALAGHDVQLKVDGIVTENRTIPVDLPANQEYWEPFTTTITLSGSSDNITVIADVNNEVAESDETNNSQGSVWPSPPPPPPPLVVVSINAPAKVAPNRYFTATVDISQVQNLDACNYDISFNPAVLRLDNVTDGNIGGAVFPVDLWKQFSPGHAAVVQNISGPSGASGFGNLAVLHFHVIGSTGQSSNITLSNGTLSSVLAEEIPAAWFNDLVIVSVIPGDANGDGVVNAIDITKVERIIAHLDTPTTGADANLDSFVDAIDITRVEMIIVGLD